MSARESGLIAVIDSGVGGLSVWNELRSLLPDEPTIYFADQGHVPYGSRSLDEVRRFAEEIARFLLEEGAKIIVVASNTTSAAALYPLRERFPQLPFVGMEPAIKPAAERTRSGVVGVIATQVTFQGELFANLMERYSGDVQVRWQACPGLVDQVEAGELDGPRTEGLLHEYLDPLVAAGMDQLVLGCTHYPFLRPAIERLLGPGVAIIDPAPAVARQAARVLEQAGLLARAAARGRPRDLLLTSGPESSLERSMHQLLPGREAAGWTIAGVEWREGCARWRSPSNG